MFSRLQLAVLANPLIVLSKCRRSCVALVRAFAYALDFRARWHMQEVRSDLCLSTFLCLHNSRMSLGSSWDLTVVQISRFYSMIILTSFLLA